MKNTIILLFLLYTVIGFSQTTPGGITINTNFQRNIAAPIDANMKISALSDTSTIVFPWSGEIIHITSLDQYWKYSDRWSRYSNIISQLSSVSDTTTLLPVTGDHFVTSNGSNSGVYSTDRWLVASGSGGSSNFIDLGDTPSSYAGQANKIPLVNPAEDGLIFVDTSGFGEGSTLLTFDVDRLPLINQKIAATGLDANEEVANYEANDINAQKFYFSSTEEYGTGGERGGWLANGTSGDSVFVSVPFGVIIGDSQAEGHNAGHGRLHPSGVATFDANFLDASGAPSYHLREETNMRVFNHGIGGQNTSEILARFDRDALGLTSDPGDGRGSKTLQRVPLFVIVVAGINDFYTGLNVDDTKANLEAMASKLAANGIYGVFLNIPGDEINNPTQNAQIDSVNTWLADGALKPYGATVVDYNLWWKGFDKDASNIDKGSLIQDDVHPTAVGYDSLAAYIAREAKLPKLDSLIIHTKIRPSGITGYSRPTSIRVDGSTAFAITDSIMPLAISQEMSWDSISLSILASTSVTGTSTTGISHVEWVVSNTYAGTDVVTRKEPNFPGRADSKWSGNDNISPTNATKVSIGTSSQHDANTTLTVDMVGSSNTNGVVFRNGSGIVKHVFRSNGNTGINRTGASYPLHVEGGASFDSGAGNYSFFIGSISQRYGSAPTTNWQSTNAGGFKTLNVQWNAASQTFNWTPQTGHGISPSYVWNSENSTNFFKYNSSNGRIGLNVGTPQSTIDLTGDIRLSGSADGTTAGKLIMEERQNSSTGAVTFRAQDTDVVTDYSWPEGGSPTAGMVLHNSEFDSLYWATVEGVSINAKTVYLADTNYIEKRSSGPNRSDMASIVQYDKDTLYLVYQRATGGSGDDADFVLDARFSYDGGLTWEDKSTIYTETDVGANNGIGYPHLFWDESSDTTHLVFFARENTSPNDDSEFWHAHSLDHGQTWTGLVQITPGDDEYYVSASNRLLKLSDGRLAIPVGKQQGEGDNAAKKIAIFYSDDAGQTWTIDSTEITSPTNFGEATEPGLIQFENDSLLLYYRTKTGSIYYTTSGNAGVDWQPEKSLGIFSGDNMSTMVYDSRKRVLYLASSPPNRAFTGAYLPSTFDDRQIITLQSSYDYGKSWSDGKIVGSHEEEVVQVFEPNIHIDTFNNNLHVFYSENGDRISLKQKIFSTEAFLDDIPSYKHNELYANRISLGRDSFAYTLRPPSILEVYEPYRDNANVDWLQLGNHVGGIKAFNIGNDGENVKPWVYYSSNVYSEGMGNRVTWKQSTGQTFSPMFSWEFGYNNGAIAPSANQILMDWRPLGGSSVMHIDNEGDLTLQGDITLANGWKTLTFAPTNTAHGVFMPSTGTGGLDIKFGTIDATDTWPWIHMKPDGNNRYGWFMGSKNTSHTATSTTIPAVRFEAVSTITGTERNALDPTSLMFDWSNDGTIVQRLFANGDLDMITGDLDIQAGNIDLGNTAAKITPETQLEVITDGITSQSRILLNSNTASGGTILEDRNPANTTESTKLVLNWDGLSTLETDDQEFSFNTGTARTSFTGSTFDFNPSTASDLFTLQMQGSTEWLRIKNDFGVGGGGYQLMYESGTFSDRQIFDATGDILQIGSSGFADFRIGALLPHTAGEADEKVMVFDTISKQVRLAALPVLRLVSEESSNFTAVAGTEIPVNTTSGSVTVTPPSSPVAGMTFAVFDSRSQAASNNITIDTSGDGLNATATDYVISLAGGYVEFKYVNATIGWRAKD